MSGFRLYQGLWACLRPWLGVLMAYRVRHGKEEKHRLNERFGQASIPPFDDSPLWIHGASVGEITAGLSLARSIRAQRPNLPLLITTTTRTGADYAASCIPSQSIHQYVPLDAQPFIASFLNTWHPRAALLIESEFWPNLLQGLAQRQIPCLSLDSHLSQRSYRWWQRSGLLFPTPFQNMTRSYVSSEEQASFFQTLGVRDVRLMPPLKFANDLLPYDPHDLHLWRQALQGRWAWLAASTHEGEEEWVLDVHQQIQKHQPESVLIWAPRHMNRLPAIRALLQKRQIPFQLHSQNPQLDPSTSCFLIDRLGLLGLFYRLCPGSFIGGSLIPNIGGHNIIEPLQVGCLPLHGPHMYHAPHVVDICRREDLHLHVDTPQEAADVLVRLYQDAAFQASFQKRAQQLCQNQKDRILITLQTMFEFF